MSERLNRMVEDGIADLLTELAGGERRRGAWLSDLVRGMSMQGIQGVSGADFEALRLSHNGLCALVRSAEGRLLLTETRLQAVGGQLATALALAAQGA